MAAVQYLFQGVNEKLMGNIYQIKNSTTPDKEYETAINVVHP